MQDQFNKVTLTRTKYEDVKDKLGKVIDTKPIKFTKEYELVFNINVIDIIDRKYRSSDKNGFDTVMERINSGNSIAVFNTSIDFMCTCINEGIRRENEHRKTVGLELLDYIKPDEIDTDFVDALNIALSTLENGLPEVKN